MTCPYLFPCWSVILNVLATFFNCYRQEDKVFCCRGEENVHVVTEHIDKNKLHEVCFVEIFKEIDFHFKGNGDTFHQFAKFHCKWRQIWDTVDRSQHEYSLGGYFVVVTRLTGFYWMFASDWITIKSTSCSSPLWFNLRRWRPRKREEEWLDEIHTHMLQEASRMCQLGS